MTNRISIFNSLAEFRKEDPKTYTYARNNNMLEEVCKIYGWSKPQELPEARWMNSYYSLCEYMKNNVEIPMGSFKFNNVCIGLWCGAQKVSYRNGTLRNDRIKLLESNNWWNWDFSEDYYWNKRFLLLSKYIKSNNKLPKKSEMFEGIKIGEWCHAQKEAYDRTRRPSTMSKKRVKLLETINIELWNKNYDNNKKCKNIENIKVIISSFLKEKGIDIFAKIIRESIEENDVNKEEYKKILKNRLY